MLAKPGVTAVASAKLVEITFCDEAAMDQAAVAVIWVGSASIVFGVRSAIGSTCM